MIGPERMAHGQTGIKTKLLCLLQRCLTGTELATLNQEFSQVRIASS